MSTIVTTVQPDKGRIRIDLDWASLFNSTPRTSACQVYRVVPALYPTPVLIREGNPCILSNLKATIYDWEAPLDTLVYYQAVVALNPDGGFERSVEGWASSLTGISTGGTPAQSTDFFYAGNASLQWTPDGVTASNRAISDPAFVVVGTSYTASAQVLASKTWGGGVGLVIRWYTSPGVFISESGTASNLWPAVGTWEPYTITATAPATAGFGRMALLITGTPPADTVFYIDEAWLTTAGGTIDSSAAPLVLPSTSGGWWKDPLHPATMVRLQDSLAWACNGMSGVALVGVSRPTRPADVAELAVPSQALGVGSFAPRKSSRRTAQVASGSFADADAVAALHSSGAPTLLQLPARYGVPDQQYWLCGDLQTSALGGDMTRSIQVHQVDMVHTQAPPGPAEGVLGCRYIDLRTGGAKLTYAAAASAGYTWLDALKGNIS